MPAIAPERSGHVTITQVAEKEKRKSSPASAGHRVTPSVALVHDYLTQRGGAERVVLRMAEALPEASVHTSLYDPSGTFPEFGDLEVRTMPLNRVGPLRHRHRLALPLLAPAFATHRIDADVVLCSSSGWAHGIRTDGRKIVYCYAPARWLYQRDLYLGSRPGMQTFDWPNTATASATRAVRELARRTSLTVLAPALRVWDLHAATGADAYLTSSTATAQAIRDAYGIEAEVLPPPPAIGPDGPEEAVDGMEPGYVLCIARLLPYKNVDAVVKAMRLLPDTRLIVVGDGWPRVAPDTGAGPNVEFIENVDDARLRWLYRNASMLVAASYEDYGLTPLEAASFGRPSVVLRHGGFLDTVVEGRTGLFFDEPSPRPIADALLEGLRTSWDVAAITGHARRYSRSAFHDRIREVVFGA